MYLVVMLLLTSLAFSQAKPITKPAPTLNSNTEKVIDNVAKGVTTVYNDAGKVAQNITPKVEKALEKLSKDLKVTADKAWDILVRQQLVNSIGILVILLVTIGSWFHFWYRYKQAIQNDNYILAAVLTVIIAIAGTITSTIFFNDMLTGFINPEFGAIKDIATIAQQLK